MNIYEYDHVFKEIPGSDEVLLTIPEEIMHGAGWEPGDTIHVTIDDSTEPTQLILRKVENV